MSSVEDNSINCSCDALPIDNPNLCMGCKEWRLFLLEDLPVMEHNLLLEEMGALDIESQGLIY